MNNYYKFITPRQLTPRVPDLAIDPDSAIKAINWVIQQSPDVVHYDLETTGLSFNDTNQIITTIGLAAPDWLVGINLMDVPFDTQQLLWDWLAQQRLGGFNLGFDLSWPFRIATADGRANPNVDDLTVASDTALWFRLLATEAHYKQSFSLETLVATVLGWPEEYQQKAWLKSAFEKHGVSKDQMWKLALLEPQGYTGYCALDAEASLQAHDVFQQTLEQWGFQGLRQYHDQILVPKIKRNIRACCSGIPINRAKLTRNIDWVTRRLLALEGQILAHPGLKPALEDWESAKLNKQHQLNFSMKKEWAKATDEPWKYPDVYRVHPVSPSKVAKLPQWCREFGGKFYKPVTQFSISGKTKEWPRFNLSSPADMKWLIYQHWLGGDYDVWYRNPDKPNWGGLVKVNVGGEQYEVDLTDSGGLPTGGAILTLFGELGNMMNEHKQLSKLLGDFLLKFHLASERTGYIHPQSKILGTITGRMSGGN